MKYKPKGHSSDTLIELYRGMLLPRMIEEKMLNLLRLGQISKWFSGIGQEAIAAGVIQALDEDEMVFPMHRNLGVFTGRGIPLWRLFNQWEGKPSGFTQGRDRSFHFGTMEYHIAGMISHLGPQLSLADGVALANKLTNRNKVAVAFTGEGGTSQGEFHEALNVAAVWELPVIFIIENNGYGLSTPVSEQYKCAHLSDRGKGYGMRSKTIDGNNVLEIFDTVSNIAKKIRRKPEPWLIECHTFRRRGHEEASGVKYVPKALIEHWEKKDPISNYETFLLKEKILGDDDLLQIKSEYKEYITCQLEEAKTHDHLHPVVEKERSEVYAPFQAAVTSPSSKTKNLRFVDAVKEGMFEAMHHHENLVLMGQDISEYGGVFKVTEGLIDHFGKERVRNTPLCESAIVGAALGLSMMGMKSMVEMQFSDFVTCGFNQIVNNLAKIYYRWGQNADVVVRMPTGAGVGAGPFHSQSTEAWFTHVPGLKVVYPSSPSEAKGLLLASFEDPNPVMFFEHKLLYRSISGEVPEGYYTIALGKANWVRQGEKASIITYGAGVHWAVEWAESADAEVDILDLRTLIPLDYDAIQKTVEKTGKVLILHEDTLTGGWGGEISAWISEHCFKALDAPVLRCGSLDTPVPFNKDLEVQFLGKTALSRTMDQLMKY